MTLSIGGFSRLVTFPHCSDCYRPERPLPGGTCTLSRTVPFHGTRLFRALPGDRALLPPSSREKSHAT